MDWGRHVLLGSTRNILKTFEAMPYGAPGIKWALWREMERPV